MTFSCKHEGPEPRNMGRGNARQVRLTSYFARPCFDCAAKLLESHIRSVTDLDGNPREESYYLAKVAEKVASLRKRY